MEVTIAIITSSIAIVVAIISGLFSYFSTKRSAKVTAMQAYLAFLEHKMNKLEEALKSYNSAEINANDDADSIIRKKIIYHNKHSINVLITYAYLFNHESAEYKRLEEIKNTLIFNHDYEFLKSLNIKINNENEDKILDDRGLVNLILQFNEDVRNLLVNELKATYQTFEDLSLLN